MNQRPANRQTIDPDGAEDYGRVREVRITLREALRAWWPAVLLVIAGFAAAYKFVEPAPPDRIVIATGAKDGAYFAFAERYRDILARSHVTLVVRSTTGSVQNYHLLKDKDSDVDIGFVQSGIGDPLDAPELALLGATYYEPVWIFYRSDTDIHRIGEFKGKRIAIGPAGSGARELASVLLRANGLSPPQGELGELSGMAAAAALRQERLDAVVLVASPQAPAVRALLRDARIRLLSFERADAYTRVFPYLASVLLPKGSIDLENNLPPEDIKLIATTANLIMRRDLHPAIAVLVAAAAKEVHSAPGLFNREGEFPAARNSNFPKSEEAERFYRSGPPFLQRYLPFWAAVFVDRMFVFLVPIIALLLPLVRLAPALYSWRVGSRIYRHYGELRFLEQEFGVEPPPERIAEYRARLDAIESRVNRLRIPLAFHGHMYTLRSHIELVRERLARLRGGPTGT